MPKKPTYDELEQKIKEIEKENLKYALREKKLMAAAKEWRITFDATRAGIFLLDKDQQILRANKTAEKIFQIPIKEMIGKHCYEIVHKTEGSINGCPLLRAKTSLKRESMELNVGEKWFEVTIDPIVDENGVYSKSVHIMTDITNRKHTEDLLRKNEKDLKESQRIAHLGSWRLDVKTNEVTWTEELYEMFDYAPELPPPSYPEHMKLFTPESWKLLSESLALTQSCGIPYELELKTIKSDGKNGWMWVRGEAEKNTAGEIIGLWGAAQDITERKKIESDREELIKKLEKTLAEIKRLEGILPLCSFCKKIRNDQGDWEPVDLYIHEHSSADISHGVCPDCMKKHYPNEYRSIYSNKK